MADRTRFGDWLYMYPYGCLPETLPLESVHTALTLLLYGTGGASTPYIRIAPVLHI